MKIDVTVSILNYNYGRFLNTAIESALAQTAGNCTIEVLVIDDGSTDESDQIIAKYESYKNFRSSKTKNQGFAASLTRAIIEAQGDYIFLMDADDYFATGKVAAMLPALKSGNFFVCDTSSYINEVGERISGGMWGSTSTVAVSKCASQPLLPVENELSFHSLYRLGKGKVLTESYTFYRVHDKSMTDKNAPGKWQTYLAQITHNLSGKLSNIASRSPVPPWGASAKQISCVADEFKAWAYYHELEAALELKQVVNSYKNCLRMLFWKLKAKKGIGIFDMKMVIKTLLFRPSKPK